MDNFKRLVKYVKHVGYIIAKIDCIVRYDDDINIIKEKLREILDKDERFDIKMYKGNYEAK